MSNTQVDVTGMQSAAKLIAESSSNIHATDQVVRNSVDGMLWTGQSAEGFRSTMQEYHRTCAGIVRTLEAMAQTVNSSANEYLATHQDSTAQVRALMEAHSSTRVPELPNFAS